ncbi:MAG: DNA polymerase IV [Clostridiales bacterium]|nr:DNA polymerase IV [Clostridiales bacterium]
MPSIAAGDGKSQDRAILHCDCNGFFASVECLDHPAYWDIPMAVAGDPKDRSGIILAKNELAKGYGIVTAETVYSARRKCPGLTLVPPRHWRYSEISKRVNAIYLQYTDQVEPFSIDESFLDVTGSLAYFNATARGLADRIRMQVKQEIGITISVGVSYNKTFAKIASDMKKPDATTEITRENYRDVLWALPIRNMLFIGKAGMEHLQSHAIQTIGDLARLPRETAESLLGKNGIGLWNNCNGLDDAPVKHFEEHEPAKSIGNGMTFRRDLVNVDEIKQGVIALSGIVAARLREHGLKACTLQVTIKDPKLKTITRQAPLASPTHLQRELVDGAMDILRAKWRIMPDGRCAPIRMLTITGQNLVRDGEAAEQVSLFDLAENGKPFAKKEKYEKLEAAITRLHQKHGAGSVVMGCVENDDLGIRTYGKYERKREENDADDT